MKQTVTSGTGETVDMIQPAHSRTPGPVPYDLHVALGAKTEVVSRPWALGLTGAASLAVV